MYFTLDPYQQSYPYPPPPGQGGYQQPGGYPPQQGGYPPQQGGYPPEQGYPPQQGYPPPQSAGAVPYPGAVLPIHGMSSDVGFINPGYPGSHPQQSGFVPLVPPQNVPYGNVPKPGGYDAEDPLGPEVKGFDFTEESIRKGFIRKVYSILSVGFGFL